MDREDNVEANASGVIEEELKRLERGEPHSLTSPESLEGDDVAVRALAEVVGRAGRNEDDSSDKKTASESTQLTNGRRGTGEGNDARGRNIRTPENGESEDNEEDGGEDEEGEDHHRNKHDEEDEDEDEGNGIGSADAVRKATPEELARLLNGRVFSVYGRTEAAKDVRQMVKDLGGEVVSKMKPGVIALVRSASSAVPQEYEDAYSFDLIYYVHSHGVLPDFTTFKIKKPPSLPGNVKINSSVLAMGHKDGKPGEGPVKPDSSIAGSSQLPPAPIANLPEHDQEGWNNAGANGVEFKTPKKRSSKFTPQEDEAIIDLIRRNPYLRSTHSFYAQIARLPMLSNHTGNSIRFRFRKILSKRLKWVYKVDPTTNEIQINPETHYPIKVDHLPGLLKSQYTAQEDYNLCKRVLDYRENPSATSKRKLDSNSVPEAVFQKMAQEYPRHSAMSWRDRYRKFASVYGLQKYVDYYDKCAADGDTPHPMKNLSSRAGNRRGSGSRRTRASSSGSSDRKRRKIVTQPTASSTNGISDLGAVKIQELARETAEQKQKSGISDAEAAAVNDAATAEAVAAAQVAQMAATKVKSEAENDKDNEDNNSISGGDHGVGQSANLFEDADEMKALNIDFTGSINPHGSLMGNVTLSSLKKAEPDPIEDRKHANAEEIVKDIEDLFGDFGSNITSSDELFKAIHAKTGFSIAWLNYWFDCSCGMFNVFLDAVQNYLKTGELIMENHPGFWTEKQDRMLHDESKLPLLYKLHGEESVNKRRATVLGQPTDEN